MGLTKAGTGPQAPQFSAPSLTHAHHLELRQGSGLMSMQLLLVSPWPELLPMAAVNARVYRGSIFKGAHGCPKLEIKVGGHQGLGIPWR